MPETVPSKRKRILFLHPNFPGQFKHLARAAASCGHDTRFLCQTHYGRTLPGVTRLTLKGKFGKKHLDSLAGDQTQRSTHLAEQYREGFMSLKNSRWDPDVVISHSGWGCGLYVRETWPICLNIAYVEWWFDPQSSFFNYDPKNDELRIDRQKTKRLWLRNQAFALELVSANEIVAPTQWQAQQLPPLLRERCRIIHDGVDLQRFQPNLKKRIDSKPIVTYGTRGMEPMRAFPQFIKSLLRIFELNQDINVEIAGEDRMNYGGRPPREHGSWGKWAKDLLTERGYGNKVKWLGHLDTNNYINWLQRSHCHVYLTHPFVASWSLLEALACECPLVVSDVEPVRELCENARSAVAYVDHRDNEALAKAIIGVLKNRHNWQSSHIPPTLDHYSTAYSLEQWSHVAGLELTTDD